jgi:hypothetical protein
MASSPHLPSEVIQHLSGLVQQESGFGTTQVNGGSAANKWIRDNPMVVQQRSIPFLSQNTDPTKFHHALVSFLFLVFRSPLPFHFRRQRVTQILQHGLLGVEADKNFQFGLPQHMMSRASFPWRRFPSGRGESGEISAIAPKVSMTLLGTCVI